MFATNVRNTSRKRRSCAACHPGASENMYVQLHDILYDKPNNENFQNKIEKVQYKASITITGAL